MTVPPQPQSSSVYVKHSGGRKCTCHDLSAGKGAALRRSSSGVNAQRLRGRFRAQATSPRRGERESGKQNKGKLSSPWGRGGEGDVRAGWRCWKRPLKERESTSIDVALKMRPIPQGDHITPEMNGAFVSAGDPCAYMDAPMGGSKRHI